MNPAERRVALVALLGRRDEPTDGVEDYCVCLGKALARGGISFELARVHWAERGWLAALRRMWRESADWRGRWVFVQYTALGWSRRGFPLGFLPVLFVLRRRKLSTAVVFHDAAAYPGTRCIDRVRRAIQQLVMKKTAARVDRIILPAASDNNLVWLKCRQGKTIFIPVGSNIPAPPQGQERNADDRDSVSRQSKMVAVFGITPGERGEREITDIRETMKAAVLCVPGVRLCVFGRGTREAEPMLRQFFEATGVEVSVLGLLPAAQIGEILSRADVQVDVRDRISSRRGSVVAGIVCGTPVVGFESAETDGAIRGAGVALVPPGDVKALTAAVSRILSDDVFREELRLRNRIASQKFFSWEAISDQLLDALLNRSTDATQRG
ncbi:MAG TPA: glycosyltransferase [Candidatus Acidoferrales bacterium]|nr:glycosyltransferase [Candidatus Acidoferrales bacterium]